MYLISIYFDEKTNKRIYQYIAQVAKASGNKYMVEENVPPHLTLSAFETDHIEAVLKALEKCVPSLFAGALQWASVGQFFPYVLFISPVLNEYLHFLSASVYEVISDIEDVSISRYYRPFQWIPHVTIGKKLERNEMMAGFQVMQNGFGMFSGQVTRIGLAKTNPYTNIAEWVLQKNDKN